jgi:hypothetical protein
MITRRDSKLGSLTYSGSRVYVNSLEQGVHDMHHPSLVHYPTSRTTTTWLIPKPEQYMSTRLLINKRKAGNLHRQVKPSIAYSYIWRLNLFLLTIHRAFQLWRWSFWLQSVKHNFSLHRALLAIPWISIPCAHTKLTSTSHLGNRSHSALIIIHKDRKCNPTSVLLKVEARNKIRVSFAPRKRIKEHCGKVKETVKHKYLPPQNPMQPVESWITLARTRNIEENETLSRSLFRKMIPHRRLQTHGQRCCPRSALSIGPH